jgi:hypothetical protein
MPANGAIYIQEENINLYDVFENVESDESLSHKPSYYDVNLNGDIVKFNIMPSTEVPNHINGFLGYISSLDQDENRKKDTFYAISHTKIVLGLVTNREFEDNHAIWNSLFKIADKYNGLVFVNESVLLPNGAVLVGPMLDENT